MAGALQARWMRHVERRCKLLSHSRLRHCDPLPDGSTRPATTEGTFNPFAMTRSFILGLSAFYHDSAACLVRDGEIVAAAQEERFTRKKHDAAFPTHAVEYCLRAGSIKSTDLDLVAFYEKPFLKFDRILHSYLAYAPTGLRSFLMAIPLWIRERIWMKELIRRELGCVCKVLFPKHHESHAASAFFPSPFSEAAFLTCDG